MKSKILKFPETIKRIPIVNCFFDEMGFKFGRNTQIPQAMGVVAIVLFCWVPLTAADDMHVRNGFWGGIDAGAGSVGLSYNQGEDEDDIFFYLGFKGGYAINPQVLIGVELGGWLLEASDLNDPGEGRGISQAFFITQIYPGRESDFFLKAGAGHVSIWSNATGDPRREQGFGLTMGCGYDFSLNASAALSPFIAFSYGDTGSWDYTAITLGLGITFP